MELLTKSWHSADDRFGNLAVIGFMLVQYLDGVYTYLGFSIWGVNIEANPLIRTAVGAVGPGTGLALAKLVAIALGMMLHLRRVHRVVAILTAIYVILSIVPWTTLLFLS
jgi:Domain of unknown function (DUF5658)